MCLQREPLPLVQLLTVNGSTWTRTVCIRSGSWECPTREGRLYSYVASQDMLRAISNLAQAAYRVSPE